MNLIVLATTATIILGRLESLGRGVWTRERRRLGLVVGLCPTS